jgi:DNA-binding NtrC family response regulator
MHGGSRELAGPAPTHERETFETSVCGGVPDVVHSLAPGEPGGMDLLVERIRANKVALKARWHVLCEARLGAQPGLTERLFQETYIPELRSAMEAVLRGDTLAFFASARALGRELAANGVPFASMVIHLSFLKESCADALADEPGARAEALLLLDRPMSALLSAAAEGYFVDPGGSPERADAASLAAPGTAPEEPPISGFFHGMVGRSPAMQRLFAQIARVASHGAPVLVLGETGTGKELVARAIHGAAVRRCGPFVALNCAALPRDLIESELFGHKRGAFSGAVSEFVGLFRAAEGGTLLLDEITEMGPELQAKLLRVLQERTVRPIGATREEPVDVRVIASCNRDPEAAMRCGLLRPDLYYRLCVSPVTVPPLAERREDIPALVEFRLAALNASAAAEGRHVRGVTERAMDMLLARSWPGNVRELFNVVENAFNMCTTLIDGADLALDGVFPFPSTVSEGPAPLPTFQESERNLIERALKITRGNKLRAAQQLGISRKKLYAKLARYGMLGVTLLLLNAPVPARIGRSVREPLGVPVVAA